MKTSKTTLPKVSEIKRQWYQVDASKNSMGRVAVEIARLLRGKHKRDFTPHMDMGDYVVAVNVDKLKFTGRKVEQKKYHHYTGYLGGLRTTSLKDVLQKNPEEALRRAVNNMIDNVKFRKQAMRRLKFVIGTKHEFKIDKEIK
ncbi:MAG: 50S ribosomal protein L13 [Candidatus Doudnabacteria bacterium CG10_big_fil_rev_8_21_14_0_10_42_18]|uniref:Large ribosomal subunit protein uL13 n=1 Tax=Candidatus Doudnabacteria bacterium CG10_big_fil_rev_8_21_14_0_10_42_18 TaxID=1974552 RepID=A0A2H0VAH3_9BACT|nr:MAG: 50S ribosomal protein L13 [Candidatus Doudnabacteria bacterium CG10_big_fil_rev_8_21_14_0_10_42_18]